MSLFLKRDTKVFIEKVGTGSNEDVYWEIPVMDGYSFSQSTTTTETVLSEMAASDGTSKRGRRVFNDALEPASWSFTTYARPFISAGTGSGAADDQLFHHAIEEVLWSQFVSQGTPGFDANVYDHTLAGLTSDGTDLNVSFANSNNVQLGVFNIYFVLGATNVTDNNFSAAANTKVMKLTGCTVNEVTLNFDVDGISMLEWSGEGSTLEEVATLDLSSAKVISEGITATTNYIRNKLTTLSLTASDTTAYPGASNNGVFNITLTGGSISFSNNISYLTPEEISIVNKPLGHITSTLNISGNLTAYIEEDSGTDTSGELLKNALADTSTITNSFAITVTVGGATAPNLAISIPTAHIEIPTVETDDIISVDIPFHGLPATIEGASNVALTYKGA